MNGWRRSRVSPPDVSHEIKNPLTSLSSAVETAARVSDPAQQRRLMTIVQEDVRRLDRLISDISNASRLDAELARAEMAELDLGRLLETLVEIHGTAGAGRGNGLELALDGGPLLADGIESRLVQVFQNLLDNAFSFSPPGAPVLIRAARENGALAITVDDEGPGIPEENLDSVFQRFTASVRKARSSAPIPGSVSRSRARSSRRIAAPSRPPTAMTGTASSRARGSPSACRRVERWRRSMRAASPSTGAGFSCSARPAAESPTSRSV